MKLLVLYSRRSAIMRKSTSDRLFSFERYFGGTVYYLNILSRFQQILLKRLAYDAIIFNESITAPWSIPEYEWAIERVKRLRLTCSIRAAFFQDEFFRINLVRRFVSELEITNIYTVAPVSQWKKLYGDLLPPVKIERVLTGYIDSKTQKRANRIALKKKRSIDIGYRTVGGFDGLTGSLGNSKVEIAKVFKELAKKNKLIESISTERSDILNGMKWFDFLSQCRYTIGVESGSSLLDYDGSIKDKVDNYRRRYVSATFEEIRDNCFRNLDGNLDLRAISPRNFDACMTRTCQILVEGEYNGILVPNTHYIPIARDFSNLDRIVELMADENGRARMVEKAYSDIVTSGRYSYAKFVEQIVGQLGAIGCLKIGLRDAFYYRLHIIVRACNVLFLFGKDFLRFLRRAYL